MRKIGIVVALLVTVLLLLGACAPASEPKPFPPPEGYSSWDEYYEEYYKETGPPASAPAPPAPPAPAEEPEETPGYIYTDGAIECGGDGEPIVLVNNPDATNPTYAELVAFIIEDTTNTNDYVKGGPEAYVCADFAEEVHNNAETAGIRAAWVSIDFQGDEEGHACNAFETVDKGLVYIDCTGELEKRWLGYSYIHQVSFELWLYEKSIPDSAKLTEWDTVAYVEVGKEYGLIGINEAKSLEYDFHLEYTQKWQEYEIKLETYNREVEQYNQEISGKVYVEGSSELARIEAWAAELDKQKQILDSLEEELGYYWYELPDGTSIVEDIHIHW